MKSLLLVAHGSRRQASNSEVTAIAQLLRKRVEGQYPLTECAFLELAEPSIPEGIEKLIEAGSNEIVILPYFLSAGRHIQEDVPGIVHSVQDKYPNIKMTIAPYLGEDDKVVDLLADISMQVSA
jgi:sirohydrochlorin ferrochelatase